MAEEEKQIRNPECFEIRMTQTAKGYWYVERVSAFGSTVEEMFKSFDKMTEETLRRLKALNKGWSE